MPGELPTRRGDLAIAADRLSRYGIGPGVLTAAAAGRAAVRPLLFRDELVGRRPVSDRLSPLRQDENCDEHDRHFRVVRVGGPPASVFLAGLLIAYLEVLDDVERSGTSLPAGCWIDLMRAPRAVFDFAAGRPVRADEPVPAPTVPARPQPDPAVLALDRWRVGHHQFFVLIQSIAVALGCALRAARTASDVELHGSLELATAAVLGSAASMRFTADFPPEVYEQTVRPRMLPPYVGPGFSGLQTRDHRFLVGVIGRIRGALPAMASAGAPYERFVAAMEQMYRAHHYVCARFGGERLPSLRMDARSSGRVTRPGVDVVAEFAAHRVAQLRPERR